MHPYVAFKGILEADPLLFVRLKPNALSEQKRVLSRLLIMEVDKLGCRPVTNQPRSARNTFAAYGCSCTYGHAIEVGETFCSILQSRLPTWRVENHGLPGYGLNQALLQLQRNARWSAADYVTFCWIPHHGLRNIADVSWILRLMEGLERSTPEGQHSFPRACLDLNGALRFKTVAIPRWDLVGVNCDEFRPAWYYLELVCFKLFERAAEIVRKSGGHFFVTTLLGNMSEHLRSRLRDAGIPLIHASVEGRGFTNLPDDHHPNVLANQIYAQKIYDYLESHHVA